MKRFCLFLLLAGCEHTMGTYVRSVTIANHTLVVEKCEVRVTLDQVTNVPCTTESHPIPMPTVAGGKP
jgi:hypothetical protein